MGIKGKCAAYAFLKPDRDNFAGTVPTTYLIRCGCFGKRTYNNLMVESENKLCKT